LFAVCASGERGEAARLVAVAGGDGSDMGESVDQIEARKGSLVSLCAIARGRRAVADADADATTSTDDAVRYGAVRYVRFDVSRHGGAVVRDRDQEVADVMRSARDGTPRGLTRGERMGRGRRVG
jgi:hypothetical protein